MATVAFDRAPEAAPADEELAAAAGAGDARAFDELYRRYSGAAWRVAFSVVRNRDDAGDAVSEAFTKVIRAAPTARSFRSYLLRTTKNCAIDIVRRKARTVAEAHDDDVADPHEPVERLMAAEEERIAVAAFAQLPERWQRALWLIDVEQRSTEDAGRELGVTAGNVAQLACRARGRLREHFVQAYVRNHVGPGCGFAVSSLGAYVAGTASARTRTKVDTHLLSCDDCRARLDELDDVAGVLRRAVFPIPALLAAGAAGRVGRVGPGAGFVRGVFDRLRRWPQGRVGQTMAQFGAEVAPASPLIERVAVGTTAVVLAAGIAIWSGGGHLPGVGGGGGSGAGRGGGAAELASGTPRPVGADGGGPGVGSVSGAGSAATGETPGLPGPVDRLGGAAGPGRDAADALRSAGGPTGIDLSNLNLSGAHLPGLDLTGVTLTGANLTGADLTGAHLTGVDLTGVNLTGANLTGADLGGTQLGGAVVGRLNAAGVNFRGARLQDLNLSGANLSGAQLPGLDLSGVDLRNANLSGADLSGAQLPGLDLSGVDLRNANLSGTSLSGTDLRNANLSGANLSGARLPGVDLSGVDLRNANLSGANLSGAQLPGVDLSGVAFRNVDLSGANLSGAQLPGVDLSGVDLRNANLSAANLSGAQLRNVDLSSVDLRSANLSGADLSGARLRDLDLSGANLNGANVTGAVVETLGELPTGQVQQAAAGLSGAVRSAATGGLPEPVAPGASLAAVLGVATSATGPAPPMLPGLRSLVAPTAGSPPSLTDGLLGWSGLPSANPGVPRAGLLPPGLVADGLAGQLFGTVASLPSPGSAGPVLPTVGPAVPATVGALTPLAGATGVGPVPPLTPPALTGPSAPATPSPSPLPAPPAAAANAASPPPLGLGALLGGLGPPAPSGAAPATGALPSPSILGVTLPISLNVH